MSDMNMLPAIKMLKDKIREVETTRDKSIKTYREFIVNAEDTAEEQLKPLRTALSILEAANDVCPRCEGKGSIKVSEIAGGHSWDPCPACRGTGKVIHTA